MVRGKRNRENLPKVIKAINDLTGGNLDDRTSDEESNTEVIDLNRPSRIATGRRIIRNGQMRSRSRIDRFIRNRQNLRGNRSASRARSRSRRRLSRRRRRRFSRDRQLERSIFRRNLLQNRNGFNSGDWIVPVAEMSDDDIDGEFNIYLITVPTVNGTEFLQNNINRNAIEYNTTDENNNSIQHENSQSNTLNFDVKRAIYSIVNSNNLSRDTQKDDGVEGTSENQQKIIELPMPPEIINSDENLKASTRNEINDSGNDKNASNQNENKKRKLV